MIALWIIGYLLIGRLFYFIDVKLGGLPSKCEDSEDYALKGISIVLWPFIFLAQLAEKLFSFIGRLIP